MRTLRLGWLVGCLLALAGCGGPEMGDPEVVIEGRWVGTLESGLLPSGSSEVVLELERGRVGEAVVARVVFGEGEAPSPAPTDPEVGWPPGIDPQTTSTVPVADGFEYQASGGTRTGTQLRIDVAVTELWAPWCALQTPYQIAPGSDESQCLPNRPWTATPFECHLDEDAENAELAVECLKLSLCRRTRVCDCTTGGGCEPSADGLTLYLDLMFDDDVAMGSIVWNGGATAAGTARVRFTRAP